MTTIVIDDKKEGAQEMLDLLQTLGFIVPFQTTPNNDSVRVRRQKLIKYPKNYEPLALAGAAEDSPLDLAEIRKGWKKK